MSALHLLWIVPVSASIGFLLGCCWLVIPTDDDYIKDAEDDDDDESL